MKKFLIITTALSSLGIGSSKAYDNYDNQEILYIIHQMIGLQIPTKVDLHDPNSSWNKMKNWLPVYAYNFTPDLDANGFMYGYHMKYRFPVVHNLADYLYYQNHYVTFENAIQDHILGLEFDYDNNGKMQNFKIPYYEIPVHDNNGYSGVKNYTTLKGAFSGLNQNDIFIRGMVDNNSEKIKLIGDWGTNLQTQFDLLLIDYGNTKAVVDDNRTRIETLETTGVASSSDIEQINDLVDLNSDRIEQNHQDIVHNADEIKVTQKKVKENKEKISQNQADIKKNSDNIEKRRQEAKDYTDQEVAKTYDVITQEYTDYVNEQINNSQSAAVESAKAYTDNKFDELKSDIEGTKKEARQAAAIGLAASALRFDQTPGKVSVGGGFGVWRGETASAFGLGYTSVTGKVRVNSTAVNSGGHWGANLGVSFTLN